MGIGESEGNDTGWTRREGERQSNTLNRKTAEVMTVHTNKTVCSNAVHSRTCPKRFSILLLFKIDTAKVDFASF